MGTPTAFSKLARSDAGVKIIDLRTPDWKDQLFQAVDPPFTPIPSGLRGEPSFHAVIQTAKFELGACSAVVEPYTSTDWHEEYGRWYSRVFRNLPRRAYRIHFFGNIGNTAVIRLSHLFEMTPETKESYLGYCVLRPLSAFRVGDTVLKSPCRAGGAENASQTGKDLVHCQAPFEVSLLGNKLSIYGMPFIQQETTVGVCAEADLWMIARYLNRLGEVRRYRPAEITSLAMRTLRSGPPREGLHDLQMVDAMDQMGLNPMRLISRDPNEVKEFLFTCVESELPVIAGIPRHVMVVIGHDCRDPLQFTGPAGSNLTMSDVVENFIVHDDASGPYRKKKAGKAKDWGIVVDEKGNLETVEVQLFTLEGHAVDFCLVALPARVSLYWDNVRKHADTWLTMVNDYISAEFGIAPSRLWGRKELPDLVLRIYLRRSDKFKHDLLAPPKGERRSEQFLAKYRCMPMPRHVWVVELAHRAKLQGVRPHERLISGEMVFDSTASRHSPEHSLLAFHLDGLMLVPGRNGRESALLVDHSEVPYRPLRRPTGAEQ